LLSWSQSFGEMRLNGDLLGEGYSGHGMGVNKPSLQAEPSIGPIPRGNWGIGEPFDSPHTGPYTIPLYPHPDTQTFARDRGSFRIHGDSKEYPGAQAASLGCIILPRSVREKIAASGEKVLLVVT
jgi:hypothetical protein